MGGRRALTPEQARATARAFTALMDAGGISQTAAIRQIAREQSVSTMTVRRYIAEAGIDLSLYSPEIAARRGARVQRVRQLYSMAEKQHIAHRAAVQAEAELAEVEAFRDSQGSLTASQSLRLARAQRMLALAIEIDEKLVRAGLPVEGWANPIPGESVSPESVLLEARRMRDHLKASSAGA